MKFNVTNEQKDLGGIYIITSSTSKDSYIGATKCFINRYKNHIQSDGRQPHLQKFIDENDTEFSVLKIFSNKEKMQKAELLFIKKLNPTINRARLCNAGQSLMYPFNTITKRRRLDILFDVTDKDKRNSIGNAARQYAKRVGKKFSVVTFDKGMQISQL